MIQLAEDTARYYHAGQIDLAGCDYIEHLARVVDRVIFCDDNVVAVAWLHDIVEDTECTLDDLYGLGFNEVVIAGVEAMTQREGEPLESYWTRVCNNREAFIVKLHGDMPDNNDPKRRTLNLGRTVKIGTKYATAIEFFWAQTQHKPVSPRNFTNEVCYLCGNSIRVGELASLDDGQPPHHIICY
jgi:hypothetical protein